MLIMINYVEWIMQSNFTKIKTNDEKEIPQLKKLKPKGFLKTIIQSVCDEFGCSEKQVKMRGRNDNKVRAIAMCLARDVSGISCKVLGYFPMVYRVRKLP